MRRIARALVLVGVVTAWNEVSDRISDHVGNDTGSFASPWKFPLIVVGVLITCGGVVGLGCVVWGKQSLRELGWTFERPGRLVAVGVLLACASIGLVVGAYAAFGGGLAGVRELGAAVAGITLGQRVFFAIMGMKNAFLEETLFRGDLLRSVSSRFGPVAAVLSSSVVHALHHRTLAPVPLCMKLVVALMLAAAVVKTRSLVPSALAHALVWAILCDN